MTAMDLSYYNARIRGMMGRLFRGADYAVLMALEGEGAFADRLRATPYGPRIESAGARFGSYSEVISIALREDFSDAFGEVWTLAPEGARLFLKAIISLWEVNTLKTILRGLARGVRREDIIDALIPAGEFPTGAINAILASKDIPDAVRFLETWGSPYAKPLKAGLKRYARDGSLSEAEINLDRHVFEYLLKALDDGSFNHRVIRGSIVLKIDILNITTLFKIAGENYSEEGAESLFIKGGERLRLKDFLILSSFKDREELLRTLIFYIKDRDLRELLSRSDPYEVPLIEERCEALVEKRFRRFSVVEPLSIALAASFIYRKAREIKNLMLIARAKAFGIPEEVVKRYLIYPA